MPFPMNEKEFENWKKTREKGSTKYAVKTSLFATIVVFIGYFITNAWVHLAEIDKYLAYNINQWPMLAITLLITFVGLFIFCKIFFSVNEKRYAESEKKKSGNNQ
jgi:ABC-type nickel/cobalt efflux system permease component RcnA